MAGTVDLYAYPLNVEQARLWLAAAGGKALSADDAAFVDGCASRLGSLSTARWEPTEADWNRLMHLAEEN